MKNNVIVVSRFRFKELVSTLTEDQKRDTAFISIHEPLGSSGKELFGGASETILNTADNVLNLWFDDAEEDYPLLNGEKCVLFTDDMAQQVYDFVLENSTKKMFLLHCTMGKCRSGAVGDVISEYLGINYFDFKRSNPIVDPNTLVKILLRKKFFKP